MIDPTRRANSAPFSYQLIRSDRRTLSLSVDAQGALIARAPRRMPIAEIEGFMASKARWISQKQALARSRQAARKPFRLENGADFPWLGGSLRVVICNVPFAFEYHGALLIPNAGDSAEHVHLWMKRRAAELIAPRVSHYADEMGFRPFSIAYTTAKKRWGSMSSTKHLRLNLALLHCPLPLTDYVIVHELAHIRHPDHSPAFHALVRSVLTDADARRSKLQALSYLTTLLCADDR